jgi:hypothetical protein
MAVTAESFLLAYPEFEPIHEQQTTLIAAVIARAELRITASWEPADQRDQAVELQAAHMLALSPAGRNAKLSLPGEETAYEAELKARKKGYAFARLRVV